MATFEIDNEPRIQLTLTATEVRALVEALHHSVPNNTTESGVTCDLLNFLSDALEECTSVSS